MAASSAVWRRAVELVLPDASSVAVSFAVADVLVLTAGIAPGEALVATCGVVVGVGHVMCRPQQLDVVGSGLQQGTAALCSGAKIAHGAVFAARLLLTSGCFT